MFLIQVLPAFLGAASARYFDVLKRELVVIGQLLANSNTTKSEDQNVFVAVNIHNARVAIRL